MIPEITIARVRKWAAEKTPAHVRDQVRIEVEQTPRGLNIVERRPPWREDFGPEWSRQPIARLGYVGRRNEWTLSWADRNGKFHRYYDAEPSSSVADLLAEIDHDPTCIFWG